MSARDAGTEFRKLAAIMFTDMVGYSAIAQRNEALALELLEEHRVIVRRILPRHRGDEIKTMGDAFLVEFPSALSAVRCAIEIQKEIGDRNAVSAADRRISLRIGIHLGDIVRRENDVVGDGVNIAARIEPMAAPGGICISEDVARQIQNKVNESLVRLGPGELKNIQLPVVIYKLEPAGLSGTGTFSRKSIRGPTAWENLRAFAYSARLALLLAALVIVAVTVKIAWASKSPVTTPSLAVLPFASLSSDKENDQLCDGVTAELVNAFGRMRGLRVLSRSTTFSYKGKNEPAMHVGRELSVRHILEGSVQRSGEQVRIIVDLVNAADGSQVWTETFNENVTNSLALQAFIARRVSEALRNKLVPEEEVGGMGELHAQFDH